MLGNALSVFALEVWAYQRSGRVLDLALVILLATLPAVLATPLGGALADRVDRRRIMLGADLVSGLAMAVLAVLLATGNLTLPGVCVIVTMTAIATAFHQPAYLAAIAQLVPKPYLPQANAFSQLGLGVGTVLGPMAGGALLALTGLGGVVAVDVASFGGLLMIPWGGTRRRTTGMILSVAGIGTGTVLMGLNASVPVVATGLALRMAALSIMNAHWLAIIQVKVGPHLQGRVLATNLLLALATQPIGLLAAAPLAGTLGDSPGPGMAHLLVITGTGLIIWALVALTARPLRTLETTLPDAG
jgi:multisubunit Na+/H+ antiporter MnhF subunit